MFSKTDGIFSSSEKRKNEGKGGAPSPTIEPPSTWKQVVKNSYSHVFLTASGDVWTWSSIDGVFDKWFGSSGSSTRQDLVKNSHLKNMKEILAGTNHTYFLSDYHDNVWVLGSAFFGEAGIGEAVTVEYEEDTELWEKQKREAGTFGEIVPGIKASEIAQIITHQSTFIIKKDGTVLGCGRNDGGQLQLGHSKIVSLLTPIPSLRNVTAISTQHLECSFTLQNGRKIDYNGHQYLPKPEPESESEPEPEPEPEPEVEAERSTFGM